MEALFEDVKEQVTLLQRHIAVLKIVAQQQPIGIISVSRTLEITPAQTRYSMRILQQKGLIAPSVTGATTELSWEALAEKLEKEKNALTNAIAVIENPC